MNIKYFLLFTSILVFGGCETSNNEADQEKNTPDSDKSPVVLKEAFHTDRDEGDNVDSPAVWHGPDGQHWLLATAKEGNSIIAYDAADGSYIRRFGDGGTGAGQFQRPNGISVIDDYMLVVERDNQRIQVFSMPEFESIGYMTHEDLLLPYGLTIDKPTDQSYDMYVTDNFNPAMEGYPPEEELDKRIHHFRFSIQNDSIKSEHLGTFGDISGEGMLTKVESIYIDRAYDRLMIADEAYTQRSIKIYDLDGNFTGDIIPNTYFDSEPEGIALYACEDDSGYWIMTDQHETDINKFQVFDRETLEHLGTFKGELTRNTDGVWLSQRSFGPFEKGAFYPVHDDGSVSAFSWQEIADKLGLKDDCI